MHCLFLDGTTRLGHVEQQQAGDMQEAPSNALQVLLRDNPKRESVRKICHEAFGKYFIIDPTSHGQLRIRYSSAKPNDEMLERSFTA
jgi:hypothetical protein